LKKSHLILNGYFLLLAHSWHKLKIVDKIPDELWQKNTETSAGLEPRKSMNRRNRDGL
jgi:hypothetical protein